MIIDLASDFYPKMLRKITNPPKKLYVDGNLENLNTNCLAVVGSRNCTEYGEKWGAFFVKGLVDYGLTIVSGMAVRNRYSCSSGKYFSRRKNDSCFTLWIR